MHNEIDGYNVGGSVQFMDLSESLDLPLVLFTKQNRRESHLGR